MNVKEARDLLARIETVMRPIVDEYRSQLAPNVVSLYDEGMIRASEALETLIDPALDQGRNAS